MAKPIKHHPLIYSYLRKYQEDPTSRIFAPLAEAYRKAGLVDEAIEVAREGLRIHPNFIVGKVALARALFEKKLFVEVMDELRTVVLDAPDNLVAQRLMAESCLRTGRVAESLSAYKMLLYFVPQDAETAKIVQELEAQAYQKGTLVLRTDPISGFEEKQAKQALSAAPEEQQARWIKEIEFLQSLLQRVERYRTITQIHQ